MIYRHYAEKLMKYMILGEERGRMVQKRIAELSHGRLEVLRFLAEQTGAVGAGEISRALKLSTARVTAILNSLERQGYISRLWSREDRRRVEITITDKGRQFVKRQQEAYIADCEDMLKRLGQEDARTYIRIMKRLSELLSDAEKEEDKVDRGGI